MLKKIDWYLWDMLKAFVVLLLITYGLIKLPELESTHAGLVRMGEIILPVVQFLGTDKAALGYFFIYLIGIVAASTWFIIKTIQNTFDFVDADVISEGPFTRIFLWIERKVSKCRTSSE
jgi:hypothetical protein